MEDMATAEAGAELVMEEALLVSGLQNIYSKMYLMLIFCLGGGAGGKMRGGGARGGMRGRGRGGGGGGRPY